MIFGKNGYRAKRHFQYLAIPFPWSRILVFDLNVLSTMRIGSYTITFFLTSFLFCFLQRGLAQTSRPASAYADSILSQEAIQKESCSTDFLLRELRKDPAYQAREKKMNEDILRVLNRQVQVNGGAGTSSDPYVLPVVFHIINTNPASVTDLQIANAVKDLNDAFSKSGAYSASGGADTKIRFALAQTDPDGGITVGITRTTSFYYNNMNMNLEDTRLKNLVQWDPVKYINIWLVRNIIGEISATFSCGVWTRLNAGGYATMPSGVNSSSPTDGIVITGFGPLLAHEMGHYLSLYHTFEGYCTNNDCTKDGDRVCDTPPDGTMASVSNCASPTNSCNTDTLSNYSNGFFVRDTTDQISNFMDYNNNACQNQFTDGQGARMRAAIATQRSGLINNLMNKPCNDNILATFTRDKADPVVNDLVTFTNNSVNATSYEWFIDGVSKSTAASFSNTFTTAQKYKVTLKAINGNGCISTFSDYVLVNCGVTARFWSNKQLIASKTGVLVDTILFTNNSEGTGNSYQWILSNNNGLGRNTVTSNAVGGGANDLNYVFGQPGSYLLKLIAGNGSCVDSTNSLSITVADPTPNAYVSMFGANCYQETKVRLNVYACNFGYAPIPAGMPISFYDADPRKAGANKIDTTFLLPAVLKGICCGQSYQLTLDIKKPRLDLIYAVVNDTGNAIPISLPNTVLKESTYTDNIASISNFRFKATVTPAVATTINYGDSLKLSVRTSPDPTNSSKFLWASSKQLSCTTCDAPMFRADSSTIKTVYATSQYQCFDTAYVTMVVVKPDDYTIQINTVSCSGLDSLSVTVTVNSKPGGAGIPKKLPISIYKGDPSVAGATILLPSFLVPDSVSVQQKTYTFKVKSTTPGQLYATVNSSSTASPVSFTNAPFFEDVTTNNISAAFTYLSLNKIIDTSICNGDTLLGHTVSGTYVDKFVTAGGCDSIRTLNLVVKAAAVTKTIINIAVCSGQSYAGYTKAGTYVDVFKGTNSCDSIRTLNLVVNPVVRRTNTVQICKGDTYFAGGKMQTNSGSYVDTFKTTAGCDSIVTSVLTVNPLPANFLPLDTIVCIGQTLPITLSYPTTTWNDGTVGNSYTISQPGAYSAQVVDKNGCKGGDTVQVQFTKCIPIQIPDAFTPNRDGKNDTFKPLIGSPITNYRMQIWNRWGQLIFETRRHTEGWNGTWQGEQQQNGVYVYFFSFTDPDGVDIMRKGTLVLIR